MNTNDKGFSLIELLIVVVIIGVVAALAVPALQKGVWAAENGSTFATLRTVSSTQVSFFSQNERFGRLAELNAILKGGIGSDGVNQIFRKSYTFEMVPLNPTDAQLRNGYTILATRNVAGNIYQYRLNQTGEIVQLQP